MLRSVYDAFGAGHSSTSISAQLRRLLKFADFMRVIYIICKLGQLEYLTIPWLQL